MRNAGTSKKPKQIFKGYNIHILSQPIGLFYKYTIKFAYFFHNELKLKL